MSQDISQLESSLKDLPRTGTLVKDRGYRQVWRFEAAGKAYYLKFYPRSGFFLKRLIRGNPAMREFTRLIALQKKAIPAPRAVAVLSGFRIGSVLGDAVILEAIEPAVQLDHYLSDFEIRGQTIPHRRQLAAAVIDLVHRLSDAKLGHSDLHLGNFLLKDDSVYLLDGYAVRTNGLTLKDLLLLGHSARRFVTTADLLRGWRELTRGGEMPRNNSISKRLYRKFLERTTRENVYFGILNDNNGWRGHFLKRMKFGRSHSPASLMSFERQEWEEAWNDILRRADADQFEIIKRGRSGDVLGGEIVLGGRPIQVIIKRPKKKYWHRRLNSIGRASRVMRMWKKAWKLYIRNIPAEFPLLAMEKRTLGYVTDSLIVFEKTTGPTLASIELNSMSNRERELLFHRAGAILRRLEELGFAHFDAKATNWIVLADISTGASPVLIDVDGVRHYSWRGEGIRRLLRSMRDHPQFTRADSLALCRGYAPWARIEESSTQIE